MNRHLTLAAIAAWAVSSSAQAGTVLHVDDDAPLGGDGLTWDTAYRFLQDALANATATTEVRVAQGTYKPDQDEAGNVTSGDREAAFVLVSDLTLRGGYAGIGAKDPNEHDVRLYETILNGDLLGDDGPDFSNILDNSRHVVSCSDCVGTAVESFTITAGNADGSSFPFNQGGGMLLLGGQQSVVDCTFVKNAAQNNGGGIFSRFGILSASNCTFAGNRASSVAGTCGHGGGGVASFEGAATLSDCTFSDNAGCLGGGVSGVSFNEVPAQLTMINCLLTGHVALGGAGVLVQDVDLILMNCRMRENLSGVPLPPGGAGGALQTQSLEDPAISTVIINCELSSNVADYVGGAAVLAAHGSVVMVNCTVADNSAGDNGGGIWVSDAELTVSVWNTVLRGNTDVNGQGEASQIHIVEGQVAPNYSNIQGLTGLLGGAGNIDADPMFIDPGNGNFRLLPGSPCIDAADNSALPGGTVTDLNGNPRFHDDPGTPDTGVPGGGHDAIVDMGAYEFQGTSCLFDCDGSNDGNVNVTDLLALLSQYDPLAPAVCGGGESCDYDGNGCVDFSDLLELLAHYTIDPMGIGCP